MSKFKIRDKVKAISNGYGITTKNNLFVGEVVCIEYDRISVITISTKCNSRVGYTYSGVKSKDFQLLGSIKVEFEIY